MLKLFKPFLISCLSLVSLAAEESPLSTENSFQFHKDFNDLKIETFAKSPMINSPVAMDVDYQGRLWVADDLAKIDNKTRRGGRILVLEDTNNDGKADKAVQFGPNLTSMPLGIAVYDNVIVVSLTPDLIVFTDVNRNGKFEENIDNKEVLITGFHGFDHDHSLHAVIGAPNGQWYLSTGNNGADIKTKDGKNFHVSSYYSRNPESIGKKSSDGHTYVGGFGMSMNPDGTNAEIIFQNARNTHDMFVTSFGDLYQSDNDDPAHARVAWTMKHSNYGYASLEDGSRSWEESGKSWEEGKVSAYSLKVDRHARFNKAHWRENYPGTTPPGSMWGSGAPTGCIFIEGDELGEKYRGKFIICETVNKALFSFDPQLKDTEIDMGEKTDFLSLKPEDKSAFLPTDIVLDLNGSAYMSDWNSYSNGRGRGNPLGAIYKISTKTAMPKNPKIDFATTAGLLEALKSPAVSVRWVAVDRLKKQKDIFPELKNFYESTNNPWYKARAVWLMGLTKDTAGKKFIEGLLNHQEPQFRILALRALIYTYPQEKMKYLKLAVKDQHTAVKREVAVNLRDASYGDSKQILKEIVQAYDGKNRYYLEALGTAATGKEKEVYNELVRPNLPELTKWNDLHKSLAWRLRSSEALDDLMNCLIAQKPDIEEFRRWIMTFSLAYTPEEQAANYNRIKKMNTVFSQDDFQSTTHEVLEKDLVDKKPEVMSVSYVFPKTYGKTTKLSTSKEIAKLSGDAKKGQYKIGFCYSCHKVNNTGGTFGPDLSSWARNTSLEEVIESIVNPSARIAHGYEKAVVVENDKYRVEGIQTGYGYHAGSIKVKTVGGQTVKLAFRRSKAKIQKLENHSWMPSASTMGLSDQDVRDIAAYLKSL